MKFIARLAATLVLLPAVPAFACTDPVSVCTQSAKTSFPLISAGKPAALLIEESADSAVKLASASFANDLQRVSGQRPDRPSDRGAANGFLIVAGVVGKSPVIDELARAGKIQVSDLPGQWEAYRQIVVEKPFKNVPRALVIAGSDRRGAVFGLYDLSGKIGVSPWYWFADVPVARKAEVHLVAGSRRDQPRVRYRGFFINDEAPAFSTWAQKHFGGANSKMYANVFELLLRLKGNYLWPAMWQPRAFNDDDPQNMVLADAMGVVMGTSHHEPMTRAQAEWHRNQDQGVTGGKWDYTKNGENLRKFWRGGIERMWNGGRGYECLVTVGMRGDGDEPMSEGTATQLLESIVAAQRDIIRDVTGRPAERQPQVWALYKEVQDYYDHGMKVPDDVTLLFADDNWGQVRRLPTGDLNRKGGYGVYYHFDYVGGPRNYKWLNTNQIEKTWQQMDLTYQRGARALWIVNVGDIKPMEFPLSFFMAQAWDPEAMTLETMTNYPETWARATFGDKQAKEIADLVTRYSQLAAARKPELIDATTWSLGQGTGARLDGGEFGAVMERWSKLVGDLLKVRASVPAEQYDAFFQLVEHPILALSNLYQLYYTVAWNRKLAAANDPRANAFADRAETAFKRDPQIAAQYHALKGGKWDGMMLQTHIGYTTWQQPDKNVMPEVKRVSPTDKPGEITFAKGVSDPFGPVTIEAAKFSKANDAAGLTWKVIPNLGGSMGAVTAFPQGRPVTSQSDGVFLEYPLGVETPGDTTIAVHLLPTLETTGGVDVRIGVSMDDGPVQTLSMRLTPSPGPPTLQEQRNWEKAVINNDFVLEAKFPALAAGKHVIKVWRVDDNALVSRLVVRKD
ncbi:MAG TPA: glycosyl hydrolase 115 family protein [Steroidobacteraceae bacterium]|nr:glycosyl hydrolase 115 family protein [Steroidobacteraceae bacterium]